MKQRASNIELLRIFSMMMIMVLHFIVHVLNNDAPVGTTEWALWNANKVLTISATSIFVLISGYFGIRFTFRKLLSLYLQCFIWGLLGYLLCAFCANTPPRKNHNLIRASFCVYTQQVVVHQYLPGANVLGSVTQCRNRVF